MKTLGVTTGTYVRLGAKSLGCEKCLGRSGEKVFSEGRASEKVFREALQQGLQEQEKRLSGTDALREQVHGSALEGGC